MKTDAKILEELYEVIASRKGGDPEKSYTAKLFAKGRGKIAQKLGEEAVEAIIAALSQTPDELAGESADMFYHLLVLWAECGVRPEDVWEKLAQRMGTSGVDEKKNRKPA
jgi:phosphoribosyl-ATP pyrophosphohydrolase